jgi:hypothetical protein
LNTNSLRFVAANAPAEIVSDYGTEQQRLARLSLQIASAVLVQRLAYADGFVGSSSSLRSPLWKLKGALLLAVCTLGRAGLEVLRGLRAGIPQRLQILVSAKILTNVGNLLVDTESGYKTISKALSDERILCETSTAVSHEEPSSLDAVRDDILRALRVSLPNDLSRLIFLAILRDNNSGHYYHPEVAQRFSVEVADQAMLACHHQIYERVVALPLEDLTDQLDAYMATVRAPKERLIESWTKLRAYRATIPMDADPISTEIFFMKVGVAVAILEARLPGRIQ